jgi:hypothetical protein
MKLLSLLAVLCLMACPHESVAQAAIGSTGGTIRQGDRILEYAIGQIAIETIKSSSNAVTQGLLQPSIKVTVSVNQQFDDQYWLKVFPNPTANVLNISTDYPSFTSYVILDIQGRLIKTAAFQDPAIDISMLSNGTYVINLISKDISKSLQIIKQ